MYLCFQKTVFLAFRTRGYWTSSCIPAFFETDAAVTQDCCGQRLDLRLCENGLNLVLKRLCKDIRTCCNMSNNAEMNKQSSRCHPPFLKSPPPKVTIYSGMEYLLSICSSGLEKMVVTRMDVLSALGKFGRCSPLPFSVLVRMYIGIY